jgi:hypothetical protein
VPAPGAHERGGAAVTAADGVRLAVRPAPLEAAREALTPLHVTIENYGDAPVGIRHHNFVLRSDRGRWYTPRPPARAEGALAEHVLQPGARVSGLLFFEKLPPGTRRVRLLADFEHADSGEHIARLAIPFLAGA